MKDFYPCDECGFRAISYGIGFASEITMHCIARDGEEVTCEDGCTLGFYGPPQTLKADCEVILSDTQATIYGDYY